MADEKIENMLFHLKSTEDTLDTALQEITRVVEQNHLDGPLFETLKRLFNHAIKYSIPDLNNDIQGLRKIIVPKK